jgi:hypothetical protein
MRSLFSGLERPLPETLQDDLEDLLTWDNNAVLTWVSLDEEEDGAWRKFSVKMYCDGRLFGLALDFGIPEWMNARGVGAIVPASLRVGEVESGKRASIDLGPRKWSELRVGLPRVSRTCARLMNELWGPTHTEDVLLTGIDYAEELLPTPYPELRSYGK